jgi:hypothetical protein
MEGLAKEGLDIPFEKALCPPSPAVTPPILREKAASISGARQRNRHQAIRTGTLNTSCS